MAKQSGGFTEAGTQRAPSKDAQRGTQDELEVLVLVINQLPVVRQNIMEKLRSVRVRKEKEAKNGKSLAKNDGG